MSLRRLILITAILFSASAGWSQQKKMDLSLSGAVDIALDTNPTIKVAEMEITKANYVLKESKSSLYPTVEANGGFSRNIMLPVMFLPDGAFGPGSGGAMRIGFDNSFNASGTLSLPIYMPTIYRNISLSREQLALSIETARASKINMVNEVKNAYFNTVLAQNSLNVLYENKTNLAQIVTDIENKYKQELVAEYDLITAQVQYQNLLPIIDKAESSLKIAHYMLKVLLSLPQDVEVVLTDSFDQLKGIMDRGSLNVDLTSNTDLKQIEHQIRLQEHQYSLSRANRIPTVAASLNYSTQSQSNDFKVGDYKWASSSVAGISVRVPIFTGLKNKYKDTQIKLGINQTEINRKYLEANLSMQMSSIISNVNSAKSQIESNQKAIEQAKKAYDITNTRFRVGMGTILELNSSQLALMQAELNLNQAVYDLLVALSSYDKMVGVEK